MSRGRGAHYMPRVKDRDKREVEGRSGGVIARCEQIGYNTLINEKHCNCSGLCRRPWGAGRH